MRPQKTLGDLKCDGVAVLEVREELRKNLIERLTRAERILPGIVGYDDSVIPELENAILAGHHMVFLGERGQAKSRIIRSLVGLLDEEVPVVAGCELNDNPYAPICKRCIVRLSELGDALPVDWLRRERRYGEKLATPDVSIADLIGEIDPVKVAEGRYLADEETIHYGLVPRSNRGIFAINELPDLTEKVQVGLFNLMEEKDVQIKGYKIQLPLDVVIVASANPEDYTSRGRIITPLKDRFDVQIRTHYPKTIEDEIAIMEQEVPQREYGQRPLRVPPFLKEILAQLTMEARASSEINQSSGVSVRVTINNYESILSNAEKRALRLREPEVVPRLSDLPSLFASTTGKIEVEYVGEDVKEEDVIERLLNRAILKVFDKYAKVDDLKRVVEYFEQGWGVEVSDVMPSEEYLEGIRGIPGLREGILALGPFESPGLMAAAAEFLLEGLHLHQKVNKEREGGRYVYRA
ncbi:MAG: sigma 54-interacting transcriptional regulator [Deltaproteobacteria bacterium]|nr:sigma 54-interacting transcriptional regulator [Deltaproteobacteria bacterium]